MKSLLKTVAVAGAFLLIPSFALAQGTLAPTPIKDIIRTVASTTRAEIQGARSEVKNLVASSTAQLRDTVRAAIESRKSEVRTKVDAAKAAAKAKFSVAVQTSIGNIVDRLSKSVEHLSGVADRIDARIAELQTGGRDTTVSDSLLVTARADITAAQDAVAAVGSALTAALASKDPKAEMPKVRSAVSAAEEAIRTARQSLQKTIESLKITNQ